jgi:hypothetical protein
MPIALKHLIAVLFVVTAACGSGPETPRSKRIYSVLQSEEYRLRQQPPNGAYVYVKNAFGSEYNTIAFPLVGNRRKYVVFLANPGDGDPTYSVPESEERFILDKPTYREIVEKGYVTNPLRLYLHRHL